MLAFWMTGPVIPLAAGANSTATVHSGRRANDVSGSVRVCSNGLPALPCRSWSSN